MRMVLSDYAAQQGGRDAEDWKTNQKKEGILGLAWLGLSKAGSLLSGAWDSVGELLVIQSYRLCYVQSFVWRV